jgi:hypothetical protein
MGNSISLGIQRFFETSSSRGELYAKEYISSQYTKESDYSVILSKVEDLFRIETDVEVSFVANARMWNTTPKMLKQVFHNRYFKVQLNGTDIQIDGYKRDLNRSRLIVQAHSYDDELFMVRHSFKCHKGEDLKILKLLCDKYGLENISSIFDSVIVDPNNVAVFVEQLFGLDISYLNLNSRFFTEMQSRARAAEEELLRQKREDEFEILDLI